MSSDYLPTRFGLYLRIPLDEVRKHAPRHMRFNSLVPPILQLPHRFSKYTMFKDSTRKFGPTTVNSIIYKKLKPLRIAIKKNYGLVKENRYGI